MLAVLAAACSAPAGPPGASTTTAPADRTPSPAPTASLSPTPSPEPTPVYPEEATRLGLHVTDAELVLWRHRAEVGPFRTGGDLAPGSPGDWSRIVGSAGRLRDDSGIEPWAGPVDNNPGGCVTGGESTDSDPPAWLRVLARDAAFHALVADDRASAEAAADFLVAQAREPGLDFADTERWCGGRHIDDRNPGFELAGTLTSLVYAYDYLRIAFPEVLSPEEHELLQDWFLQAAQWMVADVRQALADLFVDREEASAPPYTLAPGRSDEPVADDRAYDRAEVGVAAAARYYNNRRAGMMRYVGVLAVLLRDVGYEAPEDATFDVDDLYDAAGQFARDYLVYSTYPDGTVGDFHRWTEDLPDLGWAYATQTVAPVVTIADTYARAGDDGLYRYLTSAGTQGTEGSPEGSTGKSLPWIARALLGYVDGSYERYIPGRGGDADARIDDRTPADGSRWHSAHDVALLPAIRWSGDDAAEDVVLRRIAGRDTWPVEPAGIGEHSPWGGDWGTLPGVLFMFAGDDEVPRPYPEPSAAP